MSTATPHALLHIIVGMPSEPDHLGSALRGDEKRKAMAHTSAREAMLEGDPEAKDPLSSKTPIDAKHSVPLGGGVSKDGKKVYIDKRIPRHVDVKNVSGKTVKVDAHDVIAHAHEAPEFPQMKQKGKFYPKAHNEDANRYEQAYLAHRYGVDHAAFNKALEPHLKAALKQGSHASDIPKDLDPKPYVDDGVAHLLKPKGTH